jgi:integrase
VECTDDEMGGLVAGITINDSGCDETIMEKRDPLFVPPDLSDGQSSSEDSDGEDPIGCGGSSSMAGATVVAPPTETVTDHIDLGTFDFSSIKGATDAQAKESSPTRGDPHRIALSIWVKGAKFCQAALLVYDIAWANGWTGSTILTFFTAMKTATLRQFLRGLTWVKLFCDSRGVHPTAFSNMANPPAFIAEFTQWLTTRVQKGYEACQARAAMCRIWGTFLHQPNLANNEVVKAVTRTITGAPRAAARYRSIFDINILFQYYLNQPPANALSFRRLTARVIVLIRIFTACRSNEIFNILWEKCEWEYDKSMVFLPTRPKDKSGKIHSMVIHALPEASKICPFRSFLYLKFKISDKWGPSAPSLCRENGEPFSRVAQIAELIQEDMTAAGVPPEYKPHSIRAAVISKGFALQLSKDQISVLSGHSLKSQTIMDHYYRDIDNWPGFRLAQNALSPIQQQEGGADTSRSVEVCGCGVCLVLRSFAHLMVLLKNLNIVVLLGLMFE